MKRLKHPVEYEYWRTCQRNVSHTATKHQRVNKTIRKWRDAEDWVARADEQDMADAKGSAETTTRSRNAHVLDGEKLVENARLNFGAYLVLLTAMNRKALDHVQGNVEPDEDGVTPVLDMDVVVRANAASARIAATLFPHLLPQQVHAEVRHSQAPAEELEMKDRVAEAAAELQLIESPVPVVVEQEEPA